MRASLAILLANLHQHRLVDHLAHIAAVRLVQIAKRAVLRDDDVVLLVELDKLLLLQPRMQLHLVDSRHNARLIQNPRELGLREVRHANGLGLARLEQLFHGFVRLAES